jgi:hypothetical protein
MRVVGPSGKALPCIKVTQNQNQIAVSWTSSLVLTFSPKRQKLKPVIQRHHGRIETRDGGGWYLFPLTWRPAVRQGVKGSFLDDGGMVFYFLFYLCIYLFFYFETMTQLPAEMSKVRLAS